jgi:hypothetical protein
MIKSGLRMRIPLLLACSSILMLAAGCKTRGKIPTYKVESAATAVPVTTTLTPSHFLHIANIQVCGGYTIQSNNADIDWGDGHDYGTLGSPAGQPPYLNYVVGQHTFSKTGVFQIHFNLTVTCINNNYNPWGDSVSGSSIAYVFNQPIEVASVTAAPAAINPGQNATCTVTLSAKAGLGGSQVVLMSDSSSVRLQQNAVDVAAGQSSGRFRVIGVSPGTANIFASSGEGTPVVFAQIKVN